MERGALPRQRVSDRTASPAWPGRLEPVVYASSKIIPKESELYAAEQLPVTRTKKIRLGRRLTAFAAIFSASRSVS